MSFASGPDGALDLWLAAQYRRMVLDLAATFDPRGGDQIHPGPRRPALPARTAHPVSAR